MASPMRASAGQSLVHAEQDDQLGGQPQAGRRAAKEGEMLRGWPYCKDSEVDFDELFVYKTVCSIANCCRIAMPRL